jgi:hypothetical protein
MIFGHGAEELGRLLPKVHFINNEEHNRKNSQMANTIALLRSRVFKDDVFNPTLEAFDLSILKTEEKRERATAVQKNERSLVAIPTTNEEKIRQYLIQSGIIEYYTKPDDLIRRFIAESEKVKANLLQSWAGTRMMDKIAHIFLQDIGSPVNFEIGRLRNEKARNYYEAYMLVSQKKPLKWNIASQVQYFKEKAASANSMLYFGKTYGEEAYVTEQYPGRKANT